EESLQDSGARDRRSKSLQIVPRLTVEAYHNVGIVSGVACAARVEQAQAIFIGKIADIEVSQHAQVGDRRRRAGNIEVDQVGDGHRDSIEQRMANIANDLEQLVGPK